MRQTGVAHFHFWVTKRPGPPTVTWETAVLPAGHESGDSHAGTPADLPLLPPAMPSLWGLAHKPPGPDPIQPQPVFFPLRGR